MFTPSSILGAWFRGLFSMALIGAATWLFTCWYRELPEPVEPSRDRVETWNDSERRHKVFLWRPGLDRPTALFLGAGLLTVISIGGGRLSYPLLLRRGDDEPKSMRSENRARLRRPDGTEIQIEQFGKADGPVIVLTHGWGVDSTEWYYLKKSLSARYRVIVWDLPGAGCSSKARNNDYSVERFARDLHAVVDWSNGSHVVLVGHSIGGMILQSYAQLFPEDARIVGLALVQTTYTNPLRTTRWGTIYSAIEKPVIVPLLYLTIALFPLVWVMNALSYLNGSAHRSTKKNSFTGRETRGQLDFVTRFMLGVSPAVLARGMLGMLAFDQSEQIRAIEIETEVISGGEDPVTLREASQYLASNIPQARHTVIPLGRHQAHMEFHVACSEVLSDFTDRRCSISPGHTSAETG